MKLTHLNTSKTEQWWKFNHNDESFIAIMDYKGGVKDLACVYREEYQNEGDIQGQFEEDFLVDLYTNVLLNQPSNA